jgi:hypothetical protein
MKFVALYSGITVLAILLLYGATVAVCGTRLQYCKIHRDDDAGGQEAGND